MNPEMPVKILFVVTSDPRSSGRVAEAVRIAAGVSVWGRLEVALFFHGPAVLALVEPAADTLVEGEHLREWWRLLAERQCPVYVERGAPQLRDAAPPAHRCQELDEAQLGALSAQTRYLLRF
jgi:hypothetical protein